MQDMVVVYCKADPIALAERHLLNVGGFLFRQGLLPHVPNNLADLLHIVSRIMQLGKHRLPVSRQRQSCPCLVCMRVQLQSCQSQSASCFSWGLPVRGCGNHSGG